MFVRDPHTAEMGKEILPFEVGHLDDFFAHKAEVELNETPENRAQAFKQIRELIQNDKVLCRCEFQDDFLLPFLRVRKFNASRAHHHLKAYVHLRRKNPEMFSNIRYDISELKMNDQIISLLPYRCQDGCALLLIEPNNWYPDTLTIEDLKRIVVICLFSALQDPMTQVNGFKLIIDAKTNPLRHLRYCTPQNLYLLYHGTQECSPARYKAFHVVNTSIVFRAAWAIAKNFFTDKIRKRFHFHSSDESLLNYFPSSVIPVKYGGELKDYSNNNWLKRVMEPKNIERMFGGDMMR